MADRRSKYAGMRESTNVEVRQPGNAADEQYWRTLRTQRELMAETLKSPGYVENRDQMEKWLNSPWNGAPVDGGFNDPDFAPIPSKGEQALINHEAAKPGEPVKPLPEITRGTGMDRRTTTVPLAPKERQSTDQGPRSLTGEVEVNRTAKDAPAGPLPPSAPEIKLDKGLPEAPAKPKPIQIPTKQHYDRVELDDFMRTLPAYGQADHGDSEIEA